MAPDTYPYAVFGFSENLDWSTLHFVKPIDDIRVCSACRAVARKAAFLPCRHVLCEPCYEQWKPRVKVCFLDGELCPEKEVYWREFPVDKMMKSKVSCWNRKNGCETITDVSSIAEHYHRDCRYHSTCCPQCSSTVLRNDIIAHLESHCVAHVVNIRSRMLPSEGIISKDVVDIRDGLRSIEAALRNVSHTNTSLASSLAGTTSLEKNLHSLLTTAAEVKQVSEATKRTLSVVGRSTERSTTQIADLKALRTRSSAELEEIKMAARESGSSEASANQGNADLEQSVDDLQVLQNDAQVLSSKLREVANKVSREAPIVAAAAAEGLSEVPNCEVLSWGEELSRTSASPRVRTRVFENVLGVPVKMIMWLHSRSDLREMITASQNVLISIDKRYAIKVRLHCPCKRERLQFQVCVRATECAVLKASPKYVLLYLLSGKNDGAQCKGYTSTPNSLRVCVR